MKWGGRGVGSERSEGWIQKDMEGSEISSSLRSLSSFRMNADSECASCACVCLNLGVWLGCITLCREVHSSDWNEAKKPSQYVTVKCALQLQTVSGTSTVCY
jgi:hypothetical protein